MRVFIHCSMGSLGEVGTTVEEKISAVKQAGFDGIDSWVAVDGSGAKEVASAARAAGLRFGAAGYLRVEDSADRLFGAAAEAGATYVELQVDGYWQDDSWVLRRTTELMSLGEKHGIPFFLETHRGRYTQDMRRTLWLLEQLAALRLCGDFSHYASSCELVAPWPPAWKDPLYRIARRCAMVHGRMNNGQRVQDPLPDVGEAQRGEFLSAWRTAREAAEATGLAEFTVTTELLPPTYQIVVNSRRAGDLWHESRELLQLVRKHVITA